LVKSQKNKSNSGGDRPLNLELQKPVLPIPTEHTFAVAHGIKSVGSRHPKNDELGIIK